MALIPPFFPDCVVAIGTKATGKEQWVASGFLYGQFVSRVSDTESEYRVYLVSNRHVFKELTSAVLRFNPQADEPARQYDLLLQKPDGTPLWVSHPNAEIDVAAIAINFDRLLKDAIQASFFRSELHVAGIEKMKELGITEGDFAYVLGFPMGLVGGVRNAVIVRGGSIARVRDALARASPSFLVDAMVFPGNSGGPVVSKPEAIAIAGTKSQGAAFLIGVVGSNLTYQDVAISAQTDRPRVIFEDNSGLAVVYPTDYVDETIQVDIKAPPQTTVDTAVDPEKTA